MEWNLLQGLLFGFISAFTEFLPVSSEAHQWLFVKMSGAGTEYIGFRLFSHVAMLIALLLSCKTQIKRLSRSIRAVSGRRKQQMDMRSILDIKVLRIAVVPLCLSFLFYLRAADLLQSTWVIWLLCLGNGLVLFFPDYLPRGNKESSGMSALDALLIGLGGAFSVIPGISRIATLTSVNRARGGDCQYSLEIALLLSIPALVILTALDCYCLFTGIGIISAKLILPYLFAAVAAFAGAYFGIILVRFLAVRGSFSGFAYYSWGTALFVFILYLTL